MRKNEIAVMKKLAVAVKAIAPVDRIVVVFDSAGSILLFNRKAEELTGYRAHEVLGKKWMHLFVPREHWGSFQKALVSASKEGIPSHKVEYPILSKEGKEIHNVRYLSLLKDEESKTDVFVTIGSPPDSHDTVGNIGAESGQSILDSIPDAVFTVDRSFHITSFNKTAETLSGYSREEAMGRFYRDIFRSRIDLDRSPLMMAVEKGCGVVDYDMTIFTRDGRELPVAVSSAVLADPDGKSKGGVAVVRDLSFIRNTIKRVDRKYSFQGIISRSKPFIELFQNLQQIAGSDATVLIQGESGTGKELVATAIHNLSRRSAMPLIRVNCAALPETLLDSEVFGYKRGAFTDAKHDKPGRFKLADGGSIFLDEIGDISLGFQAKLLRVLETKEYDPLGGVRTEKADVRIITATNRDLWALVQKGLFREDLYYRLNVIMIDLPPLRERPEDILLLGRLYLEHLNETRSKNILGCTLATKDVLLNHDYPGNVRELRNVIEHAFTLCTACRITPECLPRYLRSKSPAERQDGNRHRLEEIERNVILDTLKSNGGRVRETADELGIHRSTLWRKIKMMKIPFTQ